MKVLIDILEERFADIGRIASVQLKRRMPTVEQIIANGTVEPERKRGTWLRYGEDGYPNEVDTTTWQCDQCLETYYGRTTRIPNFCPNCGSDMRGEQE